MGTECRRPEQLMLVDHVAHLTHQLLHLSHLSLLPAKLQILLAQRLFQFLAVGEHRVLVLSRLLQTIGSYALVGIQDPFLVDLAKDGVIRQPGKLEMLQILGCNQVGHPVLNNLVDGLGHRLARLDDAGEDIIT